MTSENFQRLLDEMASLWMTCEYETVAAKFADDLFYSDAMNYSFANRNALLEFFSDEELPESCVFHRTVFDELFQIGAAEYSYEGKNRYHGTVWVTFENDKITSWREYQHISDKTYSEFWQPRS